jgi:hypothetical protein
MAKWENDACLVFKQFVDAFILGSSAMIAALACYRRKCCHCKHLQAALDLAATI